MSGSKSTTTSSWTESDVDAVLRDFFRAELPAPLRDLPTSASANAEPASVSPETKHRMPAQQPLAPRAVTARRTGRLSLAMVAGVMCIAVSLMWLSPGTPTRPTTAGKSNSDVARKSNVSASSTANVVRVAAQPVTANAGGDRDLIDGTRVWHPVVIPVELRTHAPELLIHSGGVHPEANRRDFFPDIEILRLPEFEEGEGKPKSKSAASKRDRKNKRGRKP